MSKELTPLKAFKKLKEQNDFLKQRNIPKEYRYDDELDVIENTLKEKEQQDSVLKILKEIIKFSQMLPRIEPNKDNDFNFVSSVGINIQRDIENKERELLRKWVLKTCFPKELKTLEIVKEKRVDIDLFYTVIEDENQKDKLWSYNNWVEEKLKLTQKEYDLLKEVLL